jgi:hypothetical protein
MPSGARSPTCSAPWMPTTPERPPERAMAGISPGRLDPDGRLDGNAGDMLPGEGHDDSAGPVDEAR